ncbi:MAG: tetratricopeptide repeat protein [bacterium]
MTITIIFLLLIIVPLLVIGVIVCRKIPQLTIVDLENLKLERSLVRKKEIIRKRIEEKGRKIRAKLGSTATPIKKLWGKAQLAFRVYFGKVHRLWQHEQIIKSKEEKKKNLLKHEEQLESYIQSGEACLKNEEYEKAEGCFLSAISIDQKCISAYRGLGDTYFAKKELNEARQTYRFLVNLDKEDDSTYIKLGEIAESQGDVEDAIEYYSRAIEINGAVAERYFHIAQLLQAASRFSEALDYITQAITIDSHNPRYLDLLTEIAIICGNRMVAHEAFEKLRLVNPENNKLDSFKERIEKI